MIMTQHNWLYITVSFLIIFGGIGFPILVNFKDIIVYHARRFWRLIRTRQWDNHQVHHLFNLNTKIVLIMTVLLLVFGTLAIAFSSGIIRLQACRLPISGHRLSSMPLAPNRRIQQCRPDFTEHTNHHALYSPDVDRWCGTVHSRWCESKCFCCCLTQPDRCAERNRRVEVFGRELSHDSIRRSNAAVVVSLGILFVFVFILSILEPKMSIMTLTFECVSALSTVGSSLNATPLLCDESKLLVSLLMFIGRVGFITLVLGIVKQKKNTKYRYPSDNIIIN